MCLIVRKIHSTCTHASDGLWTVSCQSRTCQRTTTMINVEPGWCQTCLESAHSEGRIHQDILRCHATIRRFWTIRELHPPHYDHLRPFMTAEKDNFMIDYDKALMRSTWAIRIRSTLLAIASADEYVMVGRLVSTIGSFTPYMYSRGWVMLNEWVVLKDIVGL
ncbi:hypothetical protein XA68_17225 [Ophiocordyceps unilateralis]|uniref:Uncharacterized protein n=1 Tax=Ophiocordyceps unilateralis TaxID=268505 RepID=A0A2A9P3D4_OPHUN|nr:hypothetical protein XA68_17225 [Ophiocordyceps unilateralis]